MRYYRRDQHRNFRKKNRRGYARQIDFVRKKNENAVTIFRSYLRKHPIERRTELPSVPLRFFSDLPFTLSLFAQAKGYIPDAYCPTNLENILRLTERETSVLALIVRGSTDRQIAGMLSIQLSTARKHRENLQSKLKVEKSAQLVWHYFKTAPDPLKKTH